MGLWNRYSGIQNLVATSKGVPEMKCEYCGATLPKLPPASSYTESYKELREHIGRLEYDYEILSTDYQEIQDSLISSNKSREWNKSKKEEYEKSSRAWRRLSIALFISNIVVLAITFS